MGNVQLLIFCWILHLLVKIDDEIFEVYMTDYSQEITKKTVPMTIDDIITYTNITTQYIDGKNI